MKTSDLVKIWTVLLVLLFVSLAIGLMKSAVAATALIFVIATLKAALVAAYYMGLKREPAAVMLLLFSGLAALAVLFAYLIPDMVIVYGRP